MINRAYEMMNKINSVVENNEDKDALADEDMEVSNYLITIDMSKIKWNILTILM